MGVTQRGKPKTKLGRAVEGLFDNQWCSSAPSANQSSIPRPKHRPQHPCHMSATDHVRVTSHTLPVHALDDPSSMKRRSPPSFTKIPQVDVKVLSRPQSTPSTPKALPSLTPKVEKAQPFDEKSATSTRPTSPPREALVVENDETAPVGEVSTLPSYRSPPLLFACDSRERYKNHSCNIHHFLLYNLLSCS